MTNSKPMGAIKRRSLQQGFTLLEMMLVVAVIALISSIAIPAFIDYMKKSRRSDARSLLLEIVAKQEQYFPNNQQQYTDDFTQLGNLAAKATTADKVTSENGYYEITIDRPTLYTFKLTAKPIGAQANDSCTTLTIDQDGTKDFTPADAIGCW